MDPSFSSPQTGATPPFEAQDPGVSPGGGQFSPNAGYPAGFNGFLPFGMTPQVFQEKAALKRSARIVGISVLILLAISLLWSFAFLLIAGRLGFHTAEAMALLQNPAVMQVLQIAISILLFTVPFLIVFKAFGQRISELVPLGKPKKGRALPMFFIGIAFCGFANIASSMLSELFSDMGVQYHVDFGEYPPGWFGFGLTFLSTAVTPALVEEFACRGLILGSLRKYGDGFAVITSSIIFGLLHGNFEQIPFAFLVGLALGFLVVETGSLWIGIAVHAFNNSVAVVFEYFLNDLSQAHQNALYAGFLAVCLLLGLASLLLLKDRRGGFRFEKAQTVSSEKQKYKWFFSSVPIILFIIVCLLEAMLYFKF